MQPIPTPVTNVTLYAYFNPTEPIMEIVLKGAQGTYCVGTLLTSVFYNLDLSSEGANPGKLIAHSKYYAVCETAGGQTFTTPWMYCLDNSAQPKFGRTMAVNLPEGALMPPASSGANTPGYITLAPLTDITVSQQFPGFAIGQRTLITGGNGNMIATQFGTPHEPGVSVTGGTRFGQIAPGMKGIMVTGKLKSGELYSLTGLTAAATGDTVILLKPFFGEN